MGEEKNGVPNGEMPPQEESSKILLNEGAEPKPEVWRRRGETNIMFRAGVVRSKMWVFSYIIHLVFF